MEENIPHFKLVSNKMKHIEMKETQQTSTK